MNRVQTSDDFVLLTLSLKKHDEHKKKKKKQVHIQANNINDFKFIRRVFLFLFLLFIKHINKFPLRLG